MSTKAGALLWNRQRITLVAGANSIDTGLRQVNQNWGASSDNEPPLGVEGVAPPAPGTGPASRVQVIPMAPTAAWALITIGEPWLNTATGTVFVTLTNGGQTVEVNALFWDPHTAIGPGQAATYNAPA